MNDSRNNLNDINFMLSAYVDGELDFADRRRIEELIKTDSTYAQEVEELRLLKRWLADLPSPAPRRSFTLDPQTVPRPRRLLFPTLRWATAIAAVLLMLTVSVDVLGSIGSGFGGSAGSTTSGAASSASGGAAAADQAGAERFTGSAAASAANEAQVPVPAAQEAAPSASAGATTGAAATSASASAAASAIASSLADTSASFAALPSASGAASASASAAPSASFSESAVVEQGEATAASDSYPAPLADTAATTLADASVASEASSTNGGAGASISAAPSLLDTGTTGPDTVVVPARAQAQSPPVDTLRIAQIILLLATAALGAGAWFARRRNI